LKARKRNIYLLNSLKGGQKRRTEDERDIVSLCESWVIQ